MQTYRTKLLDMGIYPSPKSVLLEYRGLYIVGKYLALALMFLVLIAPKSFARDASLDTIIDKIVAEGVSTVKKTQPAKKITVKNNKEENVKIIQSENVQLLPLENTSDTDGADFEIESPPKISGNSCSIKNVKKNEAESKKPPNQKILLQANRSYSDKKRGIIILQGDARFQQEEKTISGEIANYLEKQKRLRVTGDVRYAGEDINVNAPYLEHDTNKKETYFLGARYFLPESDINGKARAVKRYADKTVKLTKASYTTCDPSNPEWELKSKKVKLDVNEGVGEANHAIFKFKNVPVFYTPWIRFPLDDRRKSGFLVPSFGSTHEDGHDLEVPYYWNIAPNQDALFSPRYLEDRGLLLKNKYRYLDKYRESMIHFEGIDDDVADDDRYLLQAKHKGKSKTGNANFDLIYNQVSDDEYFEDFGNTLESISTTHMERRATLSYSRSKPRGSWSAFAQFQGFEVVDESQTRSSYPYRTLPSIGFNANWYRQKHGLNYDLFGTFAKYDHDVWVEGERFDVNWAVERPYRGDGWFFTPRFKLQHTDYSLNQADVSNSSDGSSSSPSKTLPFFSLDSGLIFERNVANLNWVQTLEPRLFYLKVPHKKQNDMPIFDTGEYEFSFAQLFRDNRFTGADRTGDADQLSLALTTRLIDTENGQENLNLSIGKIIYFRDQKVQKDLNAIKKTRRHSELAAEISFKQKSWAFTASTLIDPHEKGNPTERSAYSLYFHGKDNRLLNLSYRHRRSEIMQTDASLVMPLTNELNFVWRWNYDMRKGRDLEVLTGFEYETCCWAARLIRRRLLAGEDENTLNDIQYESNIELQFIFKGLTGVGSKLGKTFRKSIGGYEEEIY